MSATTLAPTILNRLWSTVKCRIRVAQEYSDSPRNDSALEAERELVQQMMNRNPDAFTSDLHAITMMHMFPGRF